MTAPAATIKKIRKQFEKVLSGGGADCISFGAMDTALFGGTSHARSWLLSVAARAGRAVKPTGDTDGFKTWVALLRERHAELSDEGLVDVSVGVPTADPEHCDVSFSQIDPPPKRTGAPKKVAATEAVQLCKTLEADQVLKSRIDPKLLKLLPGSASQKPGRHRSGPGMGIMEETLRSTVTVPLLLHFSERVQDFQRLCRLSPGPRLKEFRRFEARILLERVPRLLVKKVSSERYAVVGKYGQIYEAYRKLGYSEARCAVLPKPTRSVRRNGVSPKDTAGMREYVQINLFCQASIKLCELLEAEAFTKKPRTKKPSSPKVVTANSVVTRNLRRLKRESGLSYEKLAEKAGVRKQTVLANAQGTAAPRPETLKYYADVFTERLNRKVSVAEICGKTDS